MTGLLALTAVSAQPTDSKSIGDNSPISNSSDTAVPDLQNKATEDNGYRYSGALGLTDAAGIATKMAIGAAGIAYGVAQLI